MRLVATSFSVALMGCNALFGVSDLSYDGAGAGAGGEGGSAAPSCEDGIENGDERGVDCGGGCPPCPGSLGAACVSDGDCDSGHCSPDDDLCCDTRCDLECEACSSSKTGSPDGQCDFVLAGTDPDGECDATEPTTCGASGLGCSGTRTSCIVYGREITCAPASCDDGTYQAAASCDGLGSCPAGEMITCSPYSCDAAGCLSTCSMQSDCDSLSWCQSENGSCQPKRSDGSTCSADVQCLSGNCNVLGMCV